MDKTARDLESRAVCACVRDVVRSAGDGASGSGASGTEAGTRRTPEVLAIYRAFGSELDLAPLVRALAAPPGDRRPAFALPVPLPGGRMEFVAVSPAELLGGEGGEPGFMAHPGRILRDLPPDREVIPPRDIKAIVVPGLAFDRDGRRLGYGAGYYDAYLARCRAEGTAPLTVGVCLSCQLSEEALPFDERDMPVDVLVAGRGNGADVVTR